MHTWPQYSFPGEPPLTLWLLGSRHHNMRLRLFVEGMTVWQFCTDHLRTQIWIICTHRLSSLIAPCTLDHLRTQGFCHLAHLYTHTLLAGWGGGGGGLSTPAQVSTVGGGGGWGNGKHTRSSAPAQRCFHACGRVARRGGGWVGRRGNGKHMPAT